MTLKALNPLKESLIVLVIKGFSEVGVHCVVGEGKNGNLVEEHQRR